MVYSGKKSELLGAKNCPQYFIPIVWLKDDRPNKKQYHTLILVLNVKPSGALSFT